MGSFFQIWEVRLLTRAVLEDEQEDKSQESEVFSSDLEYLFF